MINRLMPIIKMTVVVLCTTIPIGPSQLTVNKEIAQQLFYVYYHYISLLYASNYWHHLLHQLVVSTFCQEPTRAYDCNIQTIKLVTSQLLSKIQVPCLRCNPKMMIQLSNYGYILSTPDRRLLAGNIYNLKCMLFLSHTFKWKFPEMGEPQSSSISR